MSSNGALGLKDGIVPLEEQLQRASVERVISARFIPNRLVDQTWTNVSGDLWSAPWLFAVLGVACDVAQVSTKTYPRGNGILRAESLAECTSTPLRFFYDLSSLVPANLARWDDPEGGIPGDLGTWDGYPLLYVNLGAGVSPVDELVCAGVEILAATRSMIQPTFGPDKLAGLGDFEEGWNTTGFPEGFNITLDLGGELAHDAPYSGASCLEFLMRPGEDRAQADAQDPLVTVVGATYRVFGYYRNRHRNTRATLLVGDGAGGQYARNGRDVVTADYGLELADSRGRYRHFAFDFRARTTSTPLSLFGKVLGAFTGAQAVDFDGVQFRRVWGMRRYHGRLVGDITVQSGSSNLWYGGKTIGVSALTLNNNDRAYDLATRALVWDGAYAEVDMAGRFGGRALKLSEIVARTSVEVPLGFDTQSRSPAAPLSDSRRMATGLIEECDTDVDLVKVTLEELRTLIYNRRSTPNLYPSDLTANMDPRVPGKPRRVIVGQAPEVEPDRIDKTAGEEVGVYELADPTLWSEGLYDVTEVWLYGDSDAASRRDGLLRLDLLTIEGVITKDLPGCKITGNTALKPFVLDVEHEYFSIFYDGVTYDCRLLQGQETTVILNAVADGGLGTVIVQGAPTMWQALEARDSARCRTASSVGPQQYMAVAFDTCPNATSIPHVEAVAVMYRGDTPDTYNENGTDTVTLFLRQISTGDRYGSDNTVNGTGASTTGSFWKAPYITPKEIRHRWPLMPHNNQPWTNAGLLDYEVGLRYRIGNNDGYLFVDLLQLQARVFLEAPITSLNPRMCIPLTLAERCQNEIARQLGGASGAAITVGYDDNDRALRFTNLTTKDFSLLSSTGKQKSAWGWLGADTGQDYPANTGVGLEAFLLQPIYIPEADIDKPVLRCTVQGYKDDALGTYTGQPGSLIELGPDVWHFLLVRFFKFPAELVDLLSFVAARQSRPVPLAMVLADETDVKTVIDGIERACRSDVIFTPASAVLPGFDVKARFVPWTGMLSGQEPLVKNAQWVTLHRPTKRSAAARKVEVTWGRTLRLKGTRSASSELAAILRRTEAIATLETDLRDETDAQAVADDLMSKVAGPEVVVGVARSALLLQVASQALLVDHDRMGYARTPFRLQDAKHNLGTGLTEITAVRFEEVS